MKENSRKKFFLLGKSKIITNGLWLYTLQLFNTLIPLITLPYITRVLGPTQYGVFSASLNIIGYFLVIVEYGFNLSGARKVAIASNHQEISEIYSRITICKLLLCVFSFTVMICFSFFLEVSKIQLYCMIILFSMVIGTSIQQTWLFQGLQKMKYITIVSVISRSISVLFVFVLINNKEQLLLYSVLYSLTFLLMGIISMLMVKIKLKLCFYKISFKELINELKDGWYLFTTSAMAKIFSSIGVTVLVFTSSEFNVGVYSAIQKIPLMVSMIYAPIGQVIFPMVSKKYENSFNEGMVVVKRVAKLMIPVATMMSLVMIIFSGFIVEILYGHEYTNYSGILIPLVVWMLLGVVNNLLGIQVLVASGHLKEYSSSFKIGVIAILIFNILLGILGNMLGIAIAAMLSELTLTIAIIYQINKIKVLKLH